MVWQTFSRWAAGFGGALLLTAAAAVPQAGAQDVGSSWVEARALQGLPAGAQVTLVQDADSALSAQVAAELTGLLSGQGITITEGAGYRLRVDLTQAVGLARRNGTTFELAGQGGNSSNTGLGGIFTIPLDRRADLPSVPPQRVALRLYEIGGGTLWLGRAESPLLGRDREDVAVDLASRLAALFGRNQSRTSIE